MLDDLLRLIQSKLGVACLVLLVPLLVLFFKRISKNLRIKRWQHALNLPKHALIFQQLYKDTNGFMLSSKARQKQDAMEYVYGEIEFLPFTALLSLTKPNNDTVFYDLGSGTGKAVLACAMVFPVKKSIGVELFPELYFSACKQKNLLVKMPCYAALENKINFILGDFLEVDLGDACLIFINSSAYFGSIWLSLCARLSKLPHLTTVITTSKPLISSDFSVSISTKIEMSWGVVTAFIHTRKLIYTNLVENIE